jgi:YHS domain-containing protein
MKFNRILPALLFSIFIISSSFAQQIDMMKKDGMNKNMKTENIEMKSDSMMMKKNDMSKEMKNGDMMKTDDMNKGMKNDMNMEKNMKKNEMMMKIEKDNNDAAINGYDPVGYFTDNKSVMGEKNFSYKWNGALWYFANKEHMEMFKENPGKYAPQYGGFCAYALTKDKLMNTDPNDWQILNGKLYLCTNDKAHRLWEKDSKENIKKADKNWSKLNSNQ